MNSVREMSTAGLAAEDFRRARADAKRLGRHTTEVLEEEFSLSQHESMAAMGRMFHYPVLDMQALNDFAPDFDSLSFTEVARRECIVLRDSEGNLAAAFCDPFEAELQEWAESVTGRSYAWHLVHPADFAAYLARYEEDMRAMDSIVSGAADLSGDAGRSEDLSLKGISEDTSPVVKLVHSTLYDALKVGASDIHIESHATGLKIKYRVDGVLTSVSEVSGVETAEQVISRIKVMSELDIAERRVPQDGRFKVTDRTDTKSIFACRSCPAFSAKTPCCASWTSSALSDELNGLRLDISGFDAESMARFRRLSSEPYGMVLVTGPTGSGKTTTLYAAISEINNGEDKIITIEDPVEYQLPGVLQIPVNEKKGLTFARGLRSILRHDPDKIMVGEIRDAGDRADRRPVRTDRAPGVHHRARQQRLRRHRPLHAYGRRSL